jgi:Protein of unknown function (DUF992)
VVEQPMRVLEASSSLSRSRPGVIHDARPNDASIEELLAFERMLADLSARFANVSVEKVEFAIVLQPLSVEGSVGVNLSLGVSALTLALAR